MKNAMSLLKYQRVLEEIENFPGLVRGGDGQPAMYPVLVRMAEIAGGGDGYCDDIRGFLGEYFGDFRVSGKAPEPFADIFGDPFDMSMRIRGGKFYLRNNAAGGRAEFAETNILYYFSIIGMARAFGLDFSNAGRLAELGL